MARGPLALLLLMSMINIGYSATTCGISVADIEKELCTLKDNMDTALTESKKVTHHTKEIEQLWMIARVEGNKVSSNENEIVTIKSNVSRISHLETVVHLLHAELIKLTLTMTERVAEATAEAHELQKRVKILEAPKVCPTCQNSGSSALSTAAGAGDACKSGPCHHGGSCFSSGTTDFYCACTPGFKGHTCTDVLNHCGSNTCKNGGSCINSVKGPLCNCAVGYEGDGCEHKVSPCDYNPCVHGKCFDTDKDVYCNCEPGYTGLLCNKPIQSPVPATQLPVQNKPTKTILADPCSNVTCIMPAICKPLGSSSHYCACPNTAEIAHNSCLTPFYLDPPGICCVRNKCKHMTFC